MLQSVHFVVLNTNPPLKFTCKLWIDVDLGKFFTVFKLFLFKSFLHETFYGFVDLQRLIFVVDHGIFTVFKGFLGFHNFWMKFFELSWIYIDLNLLMFLSKEKVCLCIYLCFNRRFEPESSRTLEFLSFFFSNSPLRSRLSSPLPVVNSRVNCRGKRFNDEGSRLNFWELPWISLHFAWIRFWKS